MVPLQGDRAITGAGRAMIHTTFCLSPRRTSNRPGETTLRIAPPRVENAVTAPVAVSTLRTSREHFREEWPSADQSYVDSLHGTRTGRQLHVCGCVVVDPILRPLTTGLRAVGRSTVCTERRLNRGTPLPCGSIAPLLDRGVAYNVLGPRRNDICTALRPI